MVPVIIIYKQVHLKTIAETVVDQKSAGVVHSIKTTKIATLHTIPKEMHNRDTAILVVLL